MIVLLDSGVLGRLCSPREDAEFETWLTGLQHRGRRVLIPEVCDYEVRREMLRASSATLEFLNQLVENFDYLPITTPAMRAAAALWARLRNEGLPTAPDAALDADCVLAGQAHDVAERERRPVVIATTNVGHLSRMADARAWRDVS